MNTFHEFDVFTSSHDLLQQGIIENQRHRILISAEQFPNEDDAALVAAQMAMTGKGDIMTTETLLRI